MRSILEKIKSGYCKRVGHTNVRSVLKRVFDLLNEIKLFIGGGGGATDN
jgi:hypothetical protein